MSSHKKALAELCSTPPPVDLQWHELKGVLEHLGYKMHVHGGSSHKFFHQGVRAVFICHRPHPLPNVDKGCIAGLVQHLKTYGFI